MSLSPDLQSMTGFATATTTTEAVALRCEIRSVNGKGLDVRARFPDGFDAVEQSVKKYAAQQLARGNLQVSLAVEASAAKMSMRVDQDLFAALAEQAKASAAKAGLAPPSADAILAIRGVVVGDDTRTAAIIDEAFVQQAIGVCHEAIDALVQNRRAEGAVIGRLLADQVDEIERLVAACANDPALDGSRIVAQLEAQLARLVEADQSKALDPSRLHAEAALLATKGDVREELDRLTAHIAAARALLAQGGAIGRKFDFLSQEFNREANTLCAKASTNSLTATGLAIKAVIDQLKEQVANIQ